MFDQPASLTGKIFKCLLTGESILLAVILRIKFTLPPIKSRQFYFLYQLLACLFLQRDHRIGEDSTIPWRCCVVLDWQGVARSECTTGPQSIRVNIFDFVISNEIFIDDLISMDESILPAYCLWLSTSCVPSMSLSSFRSMFIKFVLRCILNLKTKGIYGLCKV